MKTIKLTISKENFAPFLKAINELNDSNYITIKLLSEKDIRFEEKRVEIEYTSEQTLFYLGLLTQFYTNITFSEQ